ncbi:MAG: AAA family ATPase [Chitinophagales bacterium]|nr:AAA family ATPase [Chitinophagales bacterium]
MFDRNAIRELEKWAAKPTRKPLIIRGCRQVGKTTIIHQFAKQFKHYIYLNLELPDDKRPFLIFTDVETLLQTLFLQKNIPISQKNKTLIFIDEIQEVPEAIRILRYLYEQMPKGYVVAAGSMLETLFGKNISFPVGRVEYMVLRPVSFPEFLGAIGESEALEQLQKIPLAPFAFDKLLKLFHTYALIGGMPEAVAHYAGYKDIVAMNEVFDSLIASYLEDVEKYAVSNPQIQLLRHTITSSFKLAGKRIKFERFGNAHYGSREIGEALRILQKTMLLQLIYPVNSAVLPLIPDTKKSPRLQILDTGMLNYFAGLQTELFGSKDLSDVYKGAVIEHLVGQELLAHQTNMLSSLNFWVREKSGSTAELDFIYVFKDRLIPIEVKSGKEGKLKSLNIFMDGVSHQMAVRMYNGPLHIHEAKSTSGRKFFLLNLPYFLATQIDKYLVWIEGEVSNEF